MSKPVYYRYNPETDNYERAYPTLSDRWKRFLRVGSISVIIGITLYVVAFYVLGNPTERSLRKENNALKTQYGILERRLESALKVMDRIKSRDDNFYRVMLQMEPLTGSQRFAGLDNQSRYKELNSLSNGELISRLTKSMDLFDRQLYAQSLSFDQLRATAKKQQDKLDHIPSILPISLKDYTMSSGYGYRRDPVFGSTKFHEGLDFAAAHGTKVFATADGVIKSAGRVTGYGNTIDIDHGYNYLTRYAHLSRILVEEGKKVRRGDLIGEVGSTGKSTGPHLHYEVRFKGEPQNPVNYYFMDVTPEQYNNMIRTAENAGHVMD